VSNISAVDLQGHLDNTESILQGGVDDIADEVATIGPRIAAAIRSGFSGVDVNVTLVAPSRGLANE